MAIGQSGANLRPTPLTWCLRNSESSEKKFLMESAPNQLKTRTNKTKAEANTCYEQEAGGNAATSRPVSPNVAWNAGHLATRCAEPASLSARRTHLCWAGVTLARRAPMCRAGALARRSLMRAVWGTPGAKLPRGGPQRTITAGR